MYIFTLFAHPFIVGAEQERILVQPVDDFERGASLSFYFDGTRMSACEGETIAAALMAAGQRVFRTTATKCEPRGLFCGIGVCFD